MESSRSRRSPDLFARIEEQVAARVPDGACLLVGFSGGLDSTVLLHALAAARSRRGWRLSCAHVHHGLSMHADSWATACARQAAALDVPFTLHRVDVDTGSPDGLECAAREARYRVLAAQARHEDADVLLTGHHADDQAETLLHNLVRGAGLLGLAGMPLWRPSGSARPAQLRPLLGIARSALEACARERGLCWIEDESNSDVRHARNYLRRDVLPVLKSRWPRAAEALSGAARRLAEAQALLDELADRDAAAISESTEWGIAWRIDGMHSLAEPRRRNLLRWLLRAAGARTAPTEAWLDEWLRQILSCGPESGCPVSHAGVAGYCHRGLFWLLPDLSPPATLIWQGEQELAWGAGRLTFVVAAGAGIGQAALRPGRLMLRTRLAKDRLRRGPGRHRASVKQIAQECGLSPWLRDRAPILVVDGEPIWMPGCELSPPWLAGPEERGWMPVWTPCVAKADGSVLD